jgi:hypothetical protein
MTKTNSSISQIALYAICLSFAIFCFAAITASLDDDTLILIIPKLALGLTTAIVAIILVIVSYYISRKILNK